MALQPAYEIDLTHDGRTVTLRASLRAAVAIDNHELGFAGLVDQISRQNLTAIRAVILATATDRREAQSYLAAIADKPLSSFLQDAQAACLVVLSALFQAGDDSADQAPSQGTTNGKTVSLRAYFQNLYQYATGWLGWSPADTWASSPAEIEAAFKAHVDRLVKMTPGASSDDKTKAATGPDSNIYTPERLREIEELGYDPDFDREALRKMKAKL